MKKTLVAPRRDLRLQLLEKKKSTPRNLNGQSISIQKNISTHIQKQQKPAGQAFEGKYRNKNLTSLTAPLLVTLSTLTTLDISYNQLNDSQIELVMNSCTKITTLCIQGNINTLIPASIWKLKELSNFKHDWLKISGHGRQQSFESEQHLIKIKRIVQKPESVVKVNRVVGLDFQCYCKQIAHIPIDCALGQKIQKINCSTHTKQVMLKVVRQVELTLSRKSAKVKPIMQKQEFSLSNPAMCGFNDSLKQKQPKASVFRKKQNMGSGKDLSEAETDCGSHKIKIEDIRDISQQESPTIISDKQVAYSAPGFPLHELFANFDKNSRSPAEIDALLLKGYNPNQYDTNGLSPYHVCVVQNQKTGFQYLLQISANNPGFFDIQMPSQKEGRNILHYCVFLKNYHFTKQLIEFGFPLQQRDANGARIVHLVDQNYQFLLLLRKLFKKTSQFTRNQKSLTISTTFRKKYIKHPQRLKQQSRFKVMYNKSQKLMEMYQAAVAMADPKRH